MHILCPQNSTFMYLRHLNSPLGQCKLEPLVPSHPSHIFQPLISQRLWIHCFSFIFPTSFISISRNPLCALWSWPFTIRNILQSLHLMTKCSFTSIQNKALYRAVLALREDMASLKSSREMESFSHDPGAHLHKESGTSPQWSDLNPCLYSLFLLPTCKLLSLFSKLLQLLPSPVTF